MVIAVIVAIALMAVLEYGNRRDNDWFLGDDDDT
jgi:hypothetical protein